MEGSNQKPTSIRNPERNRNTRTKVKSEPRSTQEFMQDLALFREQTVEFFVQVRGLGCTGLNPKSVLDTIVVTAEDLEEVWGKVSSYRMTNTKLHPESRRELISLYGKIYGTKDVTNNEFMLWVVKGFILECKGEDVDWATAAASTAREKVDRCQRELDKMKLPDSPNSSAGNSQGGAGVSDGSQAFYSFANTCMKPSTKLANGMRAVSSNQEANFNSSLSQERRPVCEGDVVAIQEVLKLEIQLLDTASRKVSFLAEVRQKEADRIIGLRYSMEDRKSVAKESEETVKNIESALHRIDAEISHTSQCVIAQQGDATTVEAEALLLQIHNLKAHREISAKKLEIAKFASEDNNRRAVQGEDMYHNAEIDLWKSNSNLKVLEREITEMKRHRTAIEEQVDSLKAGVGVSLWPQPILHSHNPEDDSHLELQPCSFYNRYFCANDIVVASCRHMYHPFCIASLCSKENKCVTCGELFHPSWWQSFGFRDLDAELRDKAIQLDLPKVIEDMKLSLQEDSPSGVQVTNWSQKQSDLGSSGSTRQGNKADIESPAAAMPSVCEAPENAVNVDTAGDEVDSPIKNLLVPGMCKSVGLVDGLSKGVQAMDLLVQAVTESTDVNEGLKEEENLPDVEGLLTGEQPQEKSISTLRRGGGEKGPRYSFSNRRDLGPVAADAPTSKTISLAEVCLVVNPLSTPAPKAPKRKSSHKLGEDVCRKTQQRRNDSKKVESATIESIPETSTARITRSGAKPSH